MIEVGEDYSKDRKNDYIAEIEDGCVAGLVHAYVCTHITDLKLILLFKNR